MSSSFFREADSFEKETIIRYERIHCKKENKAGMGIIAFLIFTIVFCIYSLLFPDDNTKDYTILNALLIVVSLIFISTIINSIRIGKRQLKKILTGQYLMQKVTILGRANDKLVKGKDFICISLESDDGVPYSIYVDKPLSNKMPDNMKGILLLITNEESHLFNDKYRFIPYTE